MIRICNHRAAHNMADRCRIVIEAVLKYAQELLGETNPNSNTNFNLPADLRVLVLLCILYEMIHPTITSYQ